MKRIFCCNYISELDNLLKEKVVDVDYVKFPSINGDLNALNNALKIKPVILHGFPPFDGFLSSKDFVEKTDIKTFSQLVTLSKTPYLSGHISALNSHYPNYSVNNEHIFYDDIISTTINNVKYIKNYFNTPFALENSPFSPDHDILKCVSDPDFISKVIYNTDTYFLFDTSHARLSAYYRNMNFEDYLEKLPLDRIYEVHLSGTINLPDGSMLAPHSKMNNEDYELLKYLLKHTPVKTITLEYGIIGEETYDTVNPIFKQELYEQIINIKNILQNYK